MKQTIIVITQLEGEYDSVEKHVRSTWLVKKDILNVEYDYQYFLSVKYVEAGIPVIFREVLTYEDGVPRKEAVISFAEVKKSDYKKMGVIAKRWTFETYLIEILKATKITHNERTM